MKIAIIGLGLIGGSLSLRLRQCGFAARITGADRDPEHALKAVTLGLAEEMTTWESAVDRSSLVLLCIPVDACRELLPQVLDRAGSRVVIDMGSTKASLAACVKGHPARGRYVAAHPMWGTERSGPEAATVAAFSGKAAVICDAADSDPDALSLAARLFEQLGMYTVHMDAAAHDLHVAYISHAAHVCSFALANTVLEKEQEEDAIFELASGGFESAVRLAKSSPAMWVPILQQNRENVLEVLEDHMGQLAWVKACLENKDWASLSTWISRANDIRKVLDR